MNATTDFQMRELLEAAYLRSSDRTWNPRMKPRTLRERPQSTYDPCPNVPALHQSLVFVRGLVCQGGRPVVRHKRQRLTPGSEAAHAAHNIT